MAVRIRLKRIGKMRYPFYRVVVVDQRKRRDGRVIEEIGKYDPNQEPSLIEIKSERAQYWLGVGAQPSDQVHNLLKLTGDLARFKGVENPVSRVKYKDAEQGAKAAEAAVAAAAAEAEKRKAAVAAEKAEAEAKKAEQDAKSNEEASEAEATEEA